MTDPAAILSPDEHDRFLRLVVSSGALQFGEFTTKSGRKTPYFVNFGHMTTGAELDEWSQHYATAIERHFGRDVDVLFGPAYKGIPLAAATAMQLSRRWERPVGFAYDRKEAKAHGEGGSLVGHSFQDGDRVVIVEDVTTAGTSIRNSVPMLRAAANVDIRGLVISIDRWERGTGDDRATVEIAREFDFDVVSLTTTPRLVEALEGATFDDRIVLDAPSAERIRAHLSEHGPRDPEGA